MERGPAFWVPEDYVRRWEKEGLREMGRQVILAIQRYTMLYRTTQIHANEITEQGKKMSSIESKPRARTSDLGDLQQNPKRS